MKRHCILLLFVGIAVTAGSQNVLRYNLTKYADTPAADPELESRLTLRSQPALVDWLMTDSALSEQNIVRATASSQLHSGDYLHYEGHHTTLAEVMAGGELRISRVGTLYGRMIYSRQRRRDVFLNYADRPLDYMPYLVADTVEDGRLLRERYLVEGGLSFRLGTMRYGVSGFYEGTATAQETQPRRSVYNYWFRIGLSAAKVMPRWLLSIQVTPEINKQSISASSALNAYTYAQFYGMGQFNRKESMAGFGYSRHQDILGIGGDAVWSLLPATPRQWRLTAAVSFRYRHMETEEGNYKNLFAANTSRLSHRLTASHAIGSHADFYLTLDGYMQWRKGEERVYEQQLMNKEQNLYDYTQVGTTALYKRNTFGEALRAKGVWHALPNADFSLTAGLSIDGSDEQYLSPWASVKSTTLTPSVTLGYQLNAPNDQLSVDLGAALRTNASHRYTLTDETPTEHTMAYVPYLLQAEDYWQLTAAVAYAHKLRRGQRLGAQLSGGYLRRTGAPYAERLLLDSDHRHRLLEASVSVFFLF